MIHTPDVETLISGEPTASASTTTTRFSKLKAGVARFVGRLQKKSAATWLWITATLGTIAVAFADFFAGGAITGWSVGIDVILVALLFFAKPRIT